MKFLAVALLSVLPFVVAQDATTTPADSTSVAATSVATDATAVCEPHGDHWHCPDGVAEPTTPPPAETGDHDDHDDDHDDHTEDGFSATATTCEPHGDHYHCPDGVPEPTTPPPAVSTSASQDAQTTPPAAQSTGAAATAYLNGMAAIGAVVGGAWVL